MALPPFRVDDIGLRLKSAGNGGWVVIGEPYHFQSANVDGPSLGAEPVILGAYTSTAEMLADLVSALDVGDHEFTRGARE